ncbi:MAG: deoxyhypusine synthase [Candidatus Hadarchaeales archaeon]
MRKTPYFQKKVKAIAVRKKSISQLLAEMADTGFQGRKLGEVAEIWEKMIREKDLTIFMGLTGSMSTTGMWKIICWLIENRYIDVLVSTGANISEDILDAMGAGYWKGSHLVDDADLLKHKIDRFYDVFADELEYRKMEELIRKFVTTLDEEKIFSSAEFLYRFGEFLHKRGLKCIVSTAYKHGVPIYSPAMADSGYGVAMATGTVKDGKKVVIDQVRDFVELLEIGKHAKKTGVIYIGGGVPKDTIQLVAVMLDLVRGGETPYPHDYAIQITTDSPQWGGLSGCTLEEAISWGKISATGKRATCYCDATIALPIVSHALNERIGKPRKGRDFSWLFEKFSS